jgi:hypothetical protein
MSVPPMTQQWASPHGLHFCIGSACNRPSSVCCTCCIPTAIFNGSQPWGALAIYRPSCPPPMLACSKPAATTCKGSSTSMIQAAIKRSLDRILILFVRTWNMSSQVAATKQKKRLQEENAFCCPVFDLAFICDNRLQLLFRHLWYPNCGVIEGEERAAHGTSTELRHQFAGGLVSYTPQKWPVKPCAARGGISVTSL